jgi:cyclopropane fatty-acyl-phospholipid synthase-like methyltransferase
MPTGESPLSERHSLSGGERSWEKARAFQIGFLKIVVGLEPEHYLLDLGCGTMRGGIPIIEHLDVDHYYGIDSRREAIEEATKEIREVGLATKRPTLLVTPPDLSSFSLGERRFDVIWSVSVLIHMTDELLDSAFQFVERHLKADGAWYATALLGDHRATELDRFFDFPTITRTAEEYEDLCIEHGFEIEHAGVLSDMGLPGNGQTMLRMTLAGG